MGKHVELTDSMYALLQARALAEGLSPGEYLARLLERDTHRTDWDRVKALMDGVEPVDLPETSAEIIRRERDAR